MLAPDSALDHSRTCHREALGAARRCRQATDFAARAIARAAELRLLTDAKLAKAASFFAARLRPPPGLFPDDR